METKIINFEHHKYNPRIVQLVRAKTIYRESLKVEFNDRAECYDWIKSLARKKYLKNDDTTGLSFDNYQEIANIRYDNKSIKELNNITHIKP